MWEMKVWYFQDIQGIFENLDDFSKITINFFVALFMIAVMVLDQEHFLISQVWFYWLLFLFSPLKINPNPLRIMIRISVQSFY